MVTAARLAPGAGLAILGLTLAGLNAAHRPSRPHVQPTEGIILGSSNLLQSIDADQLSGATDGMTWWNLSQRGLVGVELFAVAEDLIEQSPPKILVLELIGDPLTDFQSNWRKSAVVSCGDFARVAWQKDASLYSKLRSCAEHLTMRLTHGLHARLRTESPEVFNPRGEISPTSRGWHPQAAPDSAWLGQLRKAEQETRRITSDDALKAANSPDCHLAPDLLQELQSMCNDRGVKLIPVLQPASGCHGCIGPARQHLRNPTILLDGGLDPSPFSTPDLMSDPRHLNATGAAIVTRQLADEILR